MCTLPPRPHSASDMAPRCNAACKAGCCSLHIWHCIYLSLLHITEGIYMRGYFLPKLSVPSILTRHHNPVYDIPVTLEVYIVIRLYLQVENT